VQAARTPDGRRLLFDGLLTLVIGGFALAVAPWVAHWQVPPRHPLDAFGYGLIVTAMLPLLVRRRWPLPALGLSVAAVAAYLGLRYPYGPVFLGPMVGVYTVGATLPVARSLGAAALTGLALLVPAVVAGRPQMVTAAQDLAWALAWLLVPWAVGAVVRLNRVSLLHDREAEDRRRAYEQRLQIAREVHDVVGHGLAVINMQAGVALHVLDRRPEQAMVALEAIRQASKESLDELRSTLAVFRQPDGGERRPGPGLGQLEGLASAMAEGGLPIELQVTGEPAGLPAAVDLAAYRIVQESLTNVARHAGASRATVRVACDDAQVVVEVTDDGHARASLGRRPGGHGIAGMRERAAALGGDLQAGPRPQGGFQVRARLPLGAPAS
jgi:signal transduction histidine kinase